ncbi:hypothetical protein RDI58_007074 [Solanum bulbocastanum]|uniref:Uncharacterized protein n=1 Tax=Solanum bulbocastanum TaxID=147425 RepID=A0AAN8TY30_SOLBU
MLSITGTKKFKDNMDNQVVIDLVENELNCEEAESYQDKLAKLEGKTFDNLSETSKYG